MKFEALEQNLEEAKAVTTLNEKTAGAAAAIERKKREAAEAGLAGAVQESRELQAQLKLAVSASGVGGAATAGGADDSVARVEELLGQARCEASQACEEVAQLKAQLAAAEARAEESHAKEAAGAERLARQEHAASDQETARRGLFNQIESDKETIERLERQCSELGAAAKLRTEELVTTRTELHKLKAAAAAPSAAPSPTGGGGGGTAAAPRRGRRQSIVAVSSLTELQGKIMAAKKREGAGEKQEAMALYEEAVKMAMGHLKQNPGACARFSVRVLHSGTSGCVVLPSGTSHSTSAAPSALAGSVSSAQLARALTAACRHRRP